MWDVTWVGVASGREPSALKTTQSRKHPLLCCNNSNDNNNSREKTRPTCGPLSGTDTGFQMATLETVLVFAYLFSLNFCNNLNNADENESSL